MDLSQIRYFLSLAETLNFTRAAEACKVSQPALTKSIRRLEEELGGTLLFRERNLTQLTEFGRAMLPMLRQTWDSAQAVRRQAASFSREERPVLRVGLGPGVSAPLLVPLMPELEQTFSNVQLMVLEIDDAALNEALLRGELDIGFSADPDTLAERVNRWPLFLNPVRVLMSTGHELADLAEVPVAALDKHPLVSCTKETTLLSRTLAELRSISGLPLHVKHHASTEEAVQHIVLTGAGIALTTGRRACLEGLVAKQLVKPVPTHQIAVATVAGRPLTRMAEALLRIARAHDWAGSPVVT